MKLKRGLFNVVVPLVFLAVIIVVGHQTQIQVETSANREVTNQLTSNVDNTRSSFALWLNEAIHTVEIASESDYLQIYFTNRTLQIYDQIERMLNERDVIGVVVQDEDGEIVVTTQNSLLGKKLKDSSFTYWNKVRSSKKAIFVKPYIENFQIQKNKELILVTAPIRIKKVGFVGAVTLIYDPNTIFKSIFETVRLGVSGETYAFDESALLISESRFIENLRTAKLIDKNDISAKFKIRLFDPEKNLLTSKNKNFKRRKFTRMVSSALSEGAGVDVSGYRDYRGVKVVGAWIWMDEYNFGFTSEMDYSEAFAQMAILNQKFKVIYTILIIFLFLTLYLNLESEKLKSKLFKTNKSLKTKTRELDSFFDAIDAHAIISKTDKKGKITFANANFVDVSQYSLQEIIGKDHRIVNSNNHSKDFFKDMWNTILANNTWHGQIQNKAKDGSDYWVSSTIFPVLGDDEKIKEFIAIRTNVTDIKIKQLEMQKAKREAERIANMRANFMANVSHELRTPLNAIIGFLTVLKDEVMEKSHQEKFYIVFHAAESLLEIINDVLDFSRLEQGKIELNLKETNLKEMLKQVYELYNIRTHGKDLVLEVNDNIDTVLYMLDGIKFKQIISNLVGNAIKFTTYGIVEVSIMSKEISTGHYDIILKVRDTGRGIQPEKLERIFTPFGQSSADDVLYDSGVGLGLSIVDGYVKLMGADLEVESEIDKGTCFTITFPNIESSSNSEEVVTQAHKVLFYDDKVTALVVDDNAINLKMMDAYLKKYGIKSIHALSGLEAISIFEEGKFDIIFMDQLMPEMKGTETTDRLRELYTELPPIISLSASTMEDDLKLFEEKFDGIMTKPIRKDALEKILQKMIKKV